MKQTAPCPECGKKIGWFNHFRDVREVCTKLGNPTERLEIPTQRALKRAEATSFCNSCGHDITEIIK